jgi:hypothetical protein
MNLMSRAVAVLVAALLAAAFSGCGSGADPDAMMAASTATNIQRLAKMYSMYTTNHNWVGPADKSELLEFIMQNSPERLRKMGIDPDNPEQLFVSERDGQEFKIRWSMQDRMYGPPLPIIFESTGVDGQYMVGFTGNKTQTVGQSEYDELWKKDFSEAEGEAESRRR